MVAVRPLEIRDRPAMVLYLCELAADDVVELARFNGEGCLLEAV